MAFSACLNDETFGPAVDGCRDNFDFTIKFERIFLSLVSASLFIVIAQVRIIFLAQGPRMVDGKWLWMLKVV
jgi:ATP-binding cassette subfamily C (CFTR/MRP) protein 1